MKSKESIFKSKLAWAVIAELAILAVAGILRPDFFRIEYNATTGMFYGSMVDIINRSSEITIIAMGMTMVIALGGTDISVGALVAVAGAFALKLLRWDVTEYPTPGDYTIYPFVLVILVPLAVCTLMGLFNGILIGKFKLEPIIATFVEAVGINPSASRVTGLKSGKIIIIVYTLTGFLSGVAGLIYSSRISSCDSNNAGVNYEMDAILAVVLGGTSMTGGKFSLTGTIIGSLIIRTITTLVYYFGITSESIMAFKAVIILVVIIIQSEPIRKRLAVRKSRKQKAGAFHG